MKCSTMIEVNWWFVWLLTTSSTHPPEKKNSIISIQISTFSLSENIIIQQDLSVHWSVYVVYDDCGDLYSKISLVIKSNIIICKFELRWSNPTSLAMAILLSLKSYKFFIKSRRKVLTPFSTLPRVLLQHTVIIHRYSPNFLLNQTIPVQYPNNGFKDMRMTAGGSYSMWNLLEWITKCVRGQQKSYIV